VSTLLIPAVISGKYTNKCGGVVEGCALFINNSVFRVLQYVEIPLKGLLRSSAYLRRHVYSVRPELMDVLGGKISTIAQFAIVQRLERVCEGAALDVVIIANTHLFYHPVADFVRLHQTHACTQLLQQLKQQIESQLSDAAFAHLSEPITVDGGETLFVAASDPVGSSGVRVSCILAGDLNSTPDTGAIAILTT
jgi:hypothetical protein